MMWSQRGDKGEGPAQEEGGIRSSGETLPRGKTGRQGGPSGERLRELGGCDSLWRHLGACWEKGRTASQDTEQLQPEQALGDKRYSKQV